MTRQQFFRTFFSLVEKNQKKRHLTQLCLKSAEKIPKEKTKPRQRTTCLGFMVSSRAMALAIFPADFLAAKLLRMALLLKKLQLNQD